MCVPHHRIRPFISLHPIRGALNSEAFSLPPRRVSSIPRRRAAQQCAEGQMRMPFENAPVHGAHAPRPAHLAALEAESIRILREVAAQAANPVLLYSIGKDSSVLLHLARKAFFPARPPFPLLHIDTTWKFRDMITFRDATASRFGLDLRVHTNPEGLRDNV